VLTTQFVPLLADSVLIAIIAVAVVLVAGTAGLVVTRKQGRGVFDRLAGDFPAPLRDDCLRQLIALTRTADRAGTR